MYTNSGDDIFMKLGGTTVTLQLASTIGAVYSQA